MKKLSKKFKSLYYVLTLLLVVAITAPLSFTSLDKKLNDLFIKFLPEAKESEKVLLVEIDDALINNTGVWPLTRNVYADMLNVMKYFEPEAFISDLSFVDKSPIQVNQDYLSKNLPHSVDVEFSNLDEASVYIMGELSSGHLDDEQANEMAYAYFEESENTKNNIKIHIQKASNDYDINLSNSLRFFDQSYLTLWMDAEIDMNTIDQDFLMNKLALDNIVSDGDTLSPDYSTVQPALDMLVKAAGDAGFVNAEPDSDGYLRRLDLVAKYHGKYFGQLVFVPILKHYGNPQVIVSNSSIILKDAKISDTETKNIVIPRCEDGTVLIRFPPKKYEEYSQRLSGWSIYRIAMLEKNLVQNLTTMQENGYFGDEDYPVWDEDETPMDLYDAVEYIRNTLSEADYDPEESGLTFEDYKTYLEAFYAMTDKFINGPYEKILLDMAGNDAELIRDILNFFRSSSEILTDIKKQTETLTPKLNGTLCVVGTTASSTTDYGVNAYDGKYANVGGHSSMANQLLNLDFVDDSPWWIGILFALIGGAIYLILCIKFKTPGKKMISGVLMVFLVALILVTLFLTTRKYFCGVVPLLSIIELFIIMTIISLISTSKEKKFIQDKFGAYVAPEIVSQLVKHPESATVGGDSKHITALFSDVKTFSGFTETVNNVAINQIREHNEEVKAGKYPDEKVLSENEILMKGAAKGAEHLVAYLNDYLGALSDAIMKEHGTIDKYVGDEIVSFFGAPIDDEDNAWNACVAGIRMLQAEDKYNKEHLNDLPINPKTGEPFLLKSRVGINTGDMVVGNMGTTRKLNYTVMGNNVNLASRLEGTNKAYNSWIMCSETTWKEATARPHDDELVARRFDCVQVVNVVQPVPIYNILGLKSELPPKQVEAAEIFNRGIDLYLKGSDTPDVPKDPEELKQAYELFNQALECYPEDRSSEVFMQRCMFYLQNGLPEIWDGVYTMTSK